MTNSYKPEDLDKLMCRAEALLGIAALREIVQSPPRNDAFSTALDAAAKANGNDPLKVTDGQIIGAKEIAYELWPIEAEIAAKSNYKGEAS
jgi:hypothetical protein